MQQMEEFVLLFLLGSFFAASRHLTIQCHIRLLHLTHTTPSVQHPKSVGVHQENKAKPNLELNIYGLITSTPVSTVTAAVTSLGTKPATAQREAR